MNIHVYHHSPPNKLPTLYGVWLPGEGWLRANKPDGTTSACAFEIKREAQSIAKLLRGHVRYIDDSLASRAVEDKIKNAEIVVEPRKNIFVRLWRSIIRRPR